MSVQLVVGQVVGCQLRRFICLQLREVGSKPRTKGEWAKGEWAKGESLAKGSDLRYFHWGMAAMLALF